MVLCGEGGKESKGCKEGKGGSASLGEGSVVHKDPVGADRAIFQTSPEVYDYEESSSGFSCVLAVCLFACLFFKSRAENSNMVSH